MSWSWRMPAKMARDDAKAARLKARQRAVSPERAAAFQGYLRRYSDAEALAESMDNRRAQHLDEFAERCDQCANDKDITAVERGPRRG